MSLDRWPDPSDSLLTSFWRTSGLNTWEILLVSVAFQASLYTISRLARKNFTVGELVVVAVFGVTLLVEATNLTIAKVRSKWLRILLTR